MISKIGGIAAKGGLAPVETGRFSSALAKAGKGASVTTAPKPQPTVASGQAQAVKSTAQVTSSNSLGPQQAVSQLLDAQRRMDDVLAMAQAGKTFTPAQLLSLQAQVYRSSQELDLAGKVVEKGVGGIKQILQTQI